MDELAERRQLGRLDKKAKQRHSDMRGRAFDRAENIANELVKSIRFDYRPALTVFVLSFRASCIHI